MPKLEPEIERILSQRKCATCRYWGQHEKGMFKIHDSRVFLARQCRVNPKLATFHDDGCNVWQRP